MTHADDTIRVAIPLQVRKKKWVAENPAARRLPTQRGPDTGPARPALHRPGVGLAAQAGARRRHYHRRPRQRGRHLRSLCQPRDPAGMAITVGAGTAGPAARAHSAVDLRPLRHGGGAMGGAAGAGV